MKAFYFSEDNKRLRYGDNRIIKAGITHKVTGDPIPCTHGLHASVDIIDALKYAPGNHLWIVELGGKIAEEGDKACATERTYLAGANIEKILQHFARRQALINIEEVKPYCEDDEYDTIIEWLNTGNKAVREAAYCAAYSASRSAACYAAHSTAYYAACSAACSAANYASRSAANYASRSAAGEMLVSMLPKRMQSLIKGANNA